MSESDVEDSCPWGARKPGHGLVWPPNKPPVTKEEAVPPWAKQEATAPPPPAAHGNLYSTWSPKSQKMAVTGTEESSGDSKTSKMASPMAQRKTLPRTDAQKKGTPGVPGNPQVESHKPNGIHNPPKDKVDPKLLQNGESKSKNEPKIPQTASTKSVTTESSATESTIKKVSLTETSTNESLTKVTKVSSSTAENESTKSESSKLISKSESSKTESESSKSSVTSSSSSRPQSNEQVPGNGPGAGATGAPPRGGQTAKEAATANLQHDASKGTNTAAERGQPQSGVEHSQVSSGSTSEVKTGAAVVSGAKVPVGDNTQVSGRAKAMVATKPGAKETKDKTGPVGQLQRQEQQQPPWRRSQEQLNNQAQQPKVQQLKQDQPPWRKSQEQLNKVSQDAPWRSKSRENLLSRSQEKLLTSSKENLATEGAKQKQENKQEPPWRKGVPGGGPRAGGSPGGEGKAGPLAGVAESASNKNQNPAAPSPATAPPSATVKASPSDMAIKAAGLTKRDVATPAKEEAKTNTTPTTAPSASTAVSSVTTAALTVVDAKLAAAEASVKTTTTVANSAPRVLVPTTATTTAQAPVTTAVPTQPTVADDTITKTTPATQIIVKPTISAPTTTTGGSTATTSPLPVPTATPAAQPLPDAPPLPPKQGLSPTAPPATAPKPLAPPRGASLQVLAKSPSSPLAAPAVAQSTVPETMAPPPPPPPTASQVSPAQLKHPAAITPSSVAAPALNNGHSNAAVTTTTGGPPPLPPPPAAAEGPKPPVESVLVPMAGEEDDKTYAKEVLHSVLSLVPTEVPTEKPPLTPTTPAAGPDPLEFPPPPPLFNSHSPAATGPVTDTETSDPSILQPLAPYLAEKPEPAFPLPPAPLGPVEDTMISDPSVLRPLVPQQPEEAEPIFPPPPGNLNLEEPNSAPVEASEDESPVYVKESVTQRVKRFNSQKSQEYEKPKDTQMPPPKPVAPWVTKTSGEEHRASPQRTLPKPPGPPPKPKPPASSSKDSVSSISMVLQHPPSGRDQAKNDSSSKGTPPPAPAVPSAATARILSRQRCDSTGDLTTDYLETDHNHAGSEVLKETQPKADSDGPAENENNDRKPLPKMPADGQVAPIPSPATAQPPSPTKNGDPLFDPWCDPANPRVIQFQDVSAAAFKIKSGIMNTPCTRSHMSSFTGMEIFFKKEFNQYTGSFKERGARYALLMLTEDQKKKGVIAASAGNHALALCYHGQDLGISVTVVMPLVAPIMKVQSCRQYGANIIVKGNDIGESRELALKIAHDEGRLYINGYDHPHILAGQGTMGLEIVEQVPNIDAVVIPCGGGGLIAGVALAVKALYPNCLIIGAESERCASFSEAMKAGKPVYVKAESTLADGLAVPKIGVNAFATARSLVDKVVTVKEEWIAIAILRLVENEKAVVEGAGATALAAVLAGELPELNGKRVVIPLCGGNIDTTVLGRCLDRGLAADGRLVKFTVTVSDRPGGIAELTRLLANLGVSIKDMMHERAWIRNDIFSVEVKVLAETRDNDHCLELQNALESRYKFVRFVSQDTVHADGLY